MSGKVVKFEKVKNEYYFYLLDGTYYYFDINTAVWYNRLREPLSERPSIWCGLTDSDGEIGKALLNLLIHTDYSITDLKTFDKIASIFIKYNISSVNISYHLIEVCQKTNDSFKFLSSFLNDNIDLGENQEDYCFSFRFQVYTYIKKYSTFMKYLNNKALDYITFWDNVKTGSDYLDIEVETFMEKYGLNFIHYCNKRIFCVVGLYKILDYYSFCEEINIPIKKGDFIKNFSEVYFLKEEKERKEKNEKIYKIQTRKNFAFENENFKVEVPTTLEEFIKLGKEFHNCLADWELDTRVLENRYTVVILRAKDDSWKIACDFENDDFYIDQFYKPYNEKVEDTETEMLLAKKIYQTYLYSIR